MGGVVGLKDKPTSFADVESLVKKYGQMVV